MSFAEEMFRIADRESREQRAYEIERHKKEIKEQVKELAKDGKFGLHYETRTELYDEVFEWCRDRDLNCRYGDKCYIIGWSMADIREIRNLKRYLGE